MVIEKEVLIFVWSYFVAMLPWVGKRRTTFIQTQLTANPSSLTFYPGKPVMEVGSADFPNAHSTMNSTLAKALCHQAIKLTVLIGSSGVGRTFTKEVILFLSTKFYNKTLNEKPLIMALSNPTSQSECITEEAYTWSQDMQFFASGSPFDPIEYNGKLYVPGQANNAYIFPGFGLGLVISGAICVHDETLLEASVALAEQVTKVNIDKGLIYPPFSNIRKISAHIAANLSAKAYELGLKWVVQSLHCQQTHLSDRSKEFCIGRFFDIDPCPYFFFNGGVKVRARFEGSMKGCCSLEDENRHD
ncbi:NADP-dependent malic enzyme-like [Camellia sinensis]|uniref:NADP-dependent malic enzyme-like n=1 Tax=Camellia sinensis TaxID=4442 RepID=UPI0010368428|nr:NADP-dependent malic enzyme-like [Camellia sinensis]